MLSQDLFNSRYERQLHEGAVDDLEHRRIDDLNRRMDDLMARARVAKPEHKAALKKEFEKVKAERDDFYRIREAQQGTYKNRDLVTPQQRVAGATPAKPGVAGAVKDVAGGLKRWLQGKPDQGPTYESQIQDTLKQYLNVEGENDVEAVKAAIQKIGRDTSLKPMARARLLGQVGMIIKANRLPVGRSYYQYMQQFMEADVSETVTDVKAGMAEIYHRLAPKIERHRDSFLAGQLYDELENYAELHGAEKEFRRMMDTARGRAHMEYDTNPGGFHNWFWFLPFEDKAIEEEKQKGVDGKVCWKGYKRMGTKMKGGKRVDNCVKMGEDQVSENTDDIKKKMSKYEKLALDANRAGDDAKCKMYQQKVQSLKQKLSQSVTEDYSDGSEAAERAILNRIMVAHTDLLKQYGPEKVMQAAEEVAYNVGDVDEIGTSDVSGWVRQVEQMLGAVSEDTITEKWSDKYKRSINCNNPKGFSQKAHCAGKKK